VPRGWKILGIAVGVLLLLMFAATFLGDEPLRRSLEKRMNASLHGYQAKVGHAHLNLFGLSITLRDVSVRQDANPEPPVLAVPHMKASVHWKELLTLHLVADFLFDGPRLNVNRPQLLQEAHDETPVKDRGWQQALESIYPLKINLLRVHDAEVTYVDEENAPPLTLQHLELRATNIRNIHSKEHVYPSPIAAKAVILGTGRGSVEGHANFLAEPYPGVHALFTLEDVPLTPFRGLVARSNLLVKDGVVSTSGEMEVAPAIQMLNVRSLDIRKVTIDLIHAPATAGKEKEAARTVKKAVKDAGKSPTTDIRLDRLSITDSEFGLVNRAARPQYRVFLSKASLTATNFSNGLRAGPGAVNLTGRFMGTGATEAHATFRQSAAGPDFDVAVAIRDTDMRGMNDLLRAYGRFDVTAGLFSFFCELTVSNGTIDGYVKPLFRDMKVYDERQDAEKSAFRKLYEKLVGGVAKLLENKKRDEVATKTSIHGPVGSPKTDIMEVISKLFQNAFFRAILPGFDAELSRQGRGAAKAGRSR
jgi:hypothetical protein